VTDVLVTTATIHSQNHVLKSSSMFEVCYVVGMVLCVLSVKEVIFIALGVCFIVMVLGPCILAIQLVLKNTLTTTTDIVCCFYQL